MLTEHAPFVRPRTVATNPQKPVDSDGNLSYRTFIFEQHSALSLSLSPSLSHPLSFSLSLSLSLSLHTVKPVVDGMVRNEDEQEEEQEEGIWNEQTLTILFSQHIPVLHHYNSWSKARKDQV